MSFIETQLQAWQDQGNKELCVTLEDLFDADKWVQITLLNFNIAYPYSEPPLECLNRHNVDIPDEIKIVEWEPETFVMFEHAWDDLRALSLFLTEYMQEVLLMIVAEDRVKISETRL